MMEYKCMVNYKYVVKVDRWYASSKTCNRCGYVYKGLTLGERKWRCPECGEVHDRDLNAAINILKEGKRIIGFRRPEFTLVESPTMDDRQFPTDLRSGGSLKQEAETEKS
jgi:putative transposase